MSHDFDFGFTAVTEDELEVVQNANDTTEKLEKLYKAVKPLLENLKANPEKDYIYWPNRVKKVEEFEKYIRSIIE
jgi:hypothetical protein